MLSTNFVRTHHFQFINLDTVRSGILIYQQYSNLKRTKFARCRPFPHTAHNGGREGIGRRNDNASRMIIKPLKLDPSRLQCFFKPLQIGLFAKCLKSENQTG